MALPPLELFSLKKRPPCCRAASSSFSFPICIRFVAGRTTRLAPCTRSVHEELVSSACPVRSSGSAGYPGGERADGSEDVCHSQGTAGRNAGYEWWPASPRGRGATFHAADPGWHERLHAGDGGGTRDGITGRKRISDRAARVTRRCDAGHRQGRHALRLARPGGVRDAPAGREGGATLSSAAPPCRGRERLARSREWRRLRRCDEAGAVR